ncbi:MAG: YicC/YloC family endoribonuclease [Clostridia bacterium]|nr:YicC/YloC family endoribonuclease [Clostridia bacterium]
MKSMTGYGKGVVSREGRELTVELKSVNHRFLDVSMRLPRVLSCIEDTLRTTIASRLSRGHVDVFVNYRNTRSDAKTVRVDETLLSAYVAAARTANEALNLRDDLTLSNVLCLPDVTEIVPSDEDADELIALAKDAAELALDGLVEMRVAEGARLKTALLSGVNAMDAFREEILARAPFVAEEYRKKLNERIEAVLSDAEIDRARLATEVALFADRCCIDEELVRLKSHIAQFRAYLEASEPVGRNMDFIVQEMNRECNTIGSKANDAALTKSVLACKAEIEKLREQIQNVE